MKRKSMLWTIIIVCIIVGIALPKVLTSKPEAKKGAGGPVKRNTVTNVSVYVVKLQPISDRIISTGNILANEQVDLKSEISGRIISLNLKEGAPVTKGQLLVKINDSDLQAQLLKAKAAYNLAKDRENRQKVLLEKAVISTEDYQTAVKDLESCNADIELITSQIRKTEIRAPFDGIIGLRSISEGAYLNVGTQIASLISLNPLKIDFAIPERYFGNIKPGAKLTFTIQANDKVYNAHVYAVEPRVDEMTRTAQARAYCDDADNFVAPGAFAKVQMVLGTNANAVVVPSQSLVPDIAGQKVFCIRQGKAVAVPVHTGIRTEQMVEVTSGLTTGDSVVTTGVMMLRPNMPVVVVADSE